MITAHIAWDLQKASGGRFTLGLGTQVKAHNERRFSVKFESPGPKMAEAIRAIRAIWDCWQTGTKLNFKGQFYTFDVMTPFFNPGPIEHPKIPIYIAAVNPFMCRRGGRAVRRHARAPVQLARNTCARSSIRRSRKGSSASGRARKDFTYATVHLRGGGRHREGAGRAGPDRQAADRLLRLDPHLPARAGRPRLGGRRRPKLHRKSVEGDWKGMADLITDEMLDTYAVTATYDKLRDALVERYGGLLDRTGALPAVSAQISNDPRLPAMVRAFNRT